MAIKIKRGTNKTSVYKAVDLWIESCENKNLKPASIETYRDKIDEFLNYTGDIYVEDLTQEYIEDFQYYLKNEHHFSAGSTNTYYRIVNVFCKFLHTRYNVPLFKIEYIKEQKTIKAVYTDDEIKRLVTRPSLDDVCYSMLRCWIASVIACNTGCRISSVVNIRKEDIDIKNRTITFLHSKNGKPFKIPVSRKVIDDLEFYMDAIDTDSEYLFLNSDTGEPLTGKQLGSSFRKYCKNKNIRTTSSFHSLRRWYSVRLLKETKDVYLVKSVLQHSNIATTQKYLASLGIDSYSNVLDKIDVMKGLL